MGYLRFLLARFANISRFIASLFFVLCGLDFFLRFALSPVSLFAMNITIHYFVYTARFL